MVFGAIGDKAGLRLALIGATSLLTAASVITAGAQAAIPLVFGAGCFGASFFSIFGLLPAYVGKTTEPGLTPMICGFVECSLGLGGAIGSFAGGHIPQVFASFQPLFVSTAVVAGAMTALAFCLSTRDVHRALPTPGL